MRLATIYWNGEEAEVKWTDNFFSASWIVRADAIHDIEAETQKQYEASLLEFRQRCEEAKK